jgi:hypothetical protein
MHRFIRMLPFGFVVLAVLIGFFVAAPNAPVASAYSTALQNFDAPTAHSEGCVCKQVCVNAQYCWTGTDPNEGCYATSFGCMSCTE